MNKREQTMNKRLDIMEQAMTTKMLATGGGCSDFLKNNPGLLRGLGIGHYPGLKSGEFLAPLATFSPPMTMFFPAHLLSSVGVGKLFSLNRRTALMIV